MNVCRNLLFILLLGALLAGCGGSNPTTPPPDTNPPATEVTFTNVGSTGIFDPSVTYDPDNMRLWMSYSYVEPSIYFNTDQHLGVGIRLAYSDDNGASWTDAGVVVSEYRDQTVGPLPSVNPALNISASSNGTWKSEMSSLVYDANAPVNERWKIIWIQYLKANGVAYWVDYSWVAMKMAATPADLASASPVKLFGGKFIQADGELSGAPAYSPIAGPAQIALDADITNAISGADPTELDLCVWAEPDLLSDASGLHLIVTCQYLSGANPDSYVVMFSCSDPCDMTQAASWTYKGHILTPAMATNIGHKNYSAADLSMKGGIYYLTATPVRDVAAGAYDGCRVYQFDDFANASLLQNAGSLVEVLRYDGLTNVHNGACSAHEEMTQGILHSQVRNDTPPVLFHMQQTNVGIP